MGNGAAPVPTPRYNTVLGASAEIARSMQHGYAGVEHLFLAIIHDRDAVPTQVLAHVVDLDEVEARLLELMNSTSYATSTREVHGQPRSAPPES